MAGSRSDAGGKQRLFDDRLGDGGVLLEERHELVAHDGADDALHLAVAELRLGLALELRLRHLHAHDDRETFAHVVAGEVVLLLDELVVGAVLVDGARESRAEAGEVRAALDGVDVVAVGLLDGRIRIGVLQRDLGCDRHAGGVRLLALEVDDRRKRLLVHVEVRDELVDAALVVERLLVVRVALVVLEVDLHALVEERQLAETRAEDLPLERAAGKDRVVGEERHPRARLLAALAHHL